MANPNIINATAIYGKTTYLLPTTTAATELLSNAALSGKVFKVNSITASNVNASLATGITLKVYTAAAIGGTGYAIVSTISVPANSTIVVVDRGYPIYLEENKSIGVTALTANDLSIVCSYEEIA